MFRSSTPGRTFLALAALPLLGGCISTVTPPPSVSDPVNVYVLDYGRHAGLVLPEATEPQNPDSPRQLVEFAFGEWRWFALGETQVWRGPGVLLIGGPGALGRRELGPDHGALPGELPPGVDEVLVIPVDQQRAEALAADLTQRWRVAREQALREAKDTPDDHPGTVTRDGMEFVPIDRWYSVNDHCNTAVRDWLRALGCEVSGSPVHAAYQISDRPPAGSTKTPATPSR